MSTDEQVFLPLSKLRLMVFSVGSIGLMISGLVMIFMSSQSSGGRRVFFLGAGLLGLFVFGSLLVNCLKKMIDDKGGLTLSAEGLDDRSGPFAAGFVSWADVTGLDVIKINGLCFLRVSVKEPELIISRASGLTRLLLNKNFKTSGSPVQLSCSGLGISFDELEAAVTGSYKKYLSQG